MHLTVVKSSAANIQESEHNFRDSAHFSCRTTALEVVANSEPLAPISCFGVDGTC